MALEGKRIAIFVEKLYEDNELWYPYFRLKEEGAGMTLVGPEAGKAYESKHGQPAKSDKGIDDVKPDEFDALVIPGGYSPDHMRRTPKMVEFVRAMDGAGKPIAAICHGPWMLALARIVEGKTVTSFFSIKDDLTNAGAEWVDREVARDGHLITSRYPPPTSRPSAAR
jgi:protease I